MAAKEIRCSFCNKTQYQVMKLIAGPKVQICNECVDICLEILSHDAPNSEPAPRPTMTVWCQLCRLPVDAEPALLVEGRGVLCQQCVAEIEASLDARP